MKDYLAFLDGFFAESGEWLSAEHLYTLRRLHYDMRVRAKAWLNRAAHAPTPEYHRLARQMSTCVRRLANALEDVFTRWMMYHPVGRSFPRTPHLGFDPLLDIYGYAYDPALYPTVSHLWAQLRIHPKPRHYPRRCQYIRSFYHFRYLPRNLTTERSPTTYVEYYAYHYQRLRARVREARLRLGSTRPDHDYEWYEGTPYGNWCAEHNVPPNHFLSWSQYNAERPVDELPAPPVYTQWNIARNATYKTARLLTAHAYEIARFHAQMPIAPPYALRFGHYIAPTEFGWTIPPHEQERWERRWSQV